MQYVNLGRTGLRVSRVCLGMMSFGNDSDRPWVLDEDAAEPIVRAAVDGGITFFDTADAYSNGASEVATGRLVGKMLTRDEMVIATSTRTTDDTIERTAVPPTGFDASGSAGVPSS